jgi:hypothetical protein
MIIFNLCKFVSRYKSVIILVKLIGISNLLWEKRKFNVYLGLVTTGGSSSEANNNT